jgi:Fe-S-cluster containining protein
MTLSRKLLRKNRRIPKAETKLLPGAYDPQQLRLTDIESISLDPADDLVTVSFLVPVGEGEAMAEFDLSFEVAEHPTLSTAALALARALLDCVKLPQPDEYPCATCTGACCGRHFTAVRVTKEDLGRLPGTEHVRMYSSEVFSGYVGELIQVPYEGPDASEEELCCPYLTREGCSIYERRPTVCRDYSAWTCDLHVEDPEKVAATSGKRKLPILNTVLDQKKSG